MRSVFPNYSPGTSVRHLLRVPGSSLSIPVFFHYGSEQGATLLVHAAVHGNEIVGVAVIHRLLEEIVSQSLAGNLILVPVVNLPAFEQVSRCHAGNEQDLNRVFPGKVTGSLTERIAHVYFHRIVALSDAIVDLHSTEFPVVMLPHVRQRVDQPTQEHKRLMSSTGLSSLWIGPGSPGMLQVQAAHEGKPCVTVEIGSTGEIREQDMVTGLRIVKNVMKSLNMIPGRVQKPKQSIVIHNTEPWYASLRAGLFRPVVRLGQSVQKGEVLTWILDCATSKAFSIEADTSGTVFAMQMLPQVRKRERLIQLAPK